MGLSKPKTLKLRGVVEGEEVVVLIDCGATHNFILMDLVEKVKLPISETSNDGVILGNGNLMKGKGMCKGVMLEM